MDEKGKHITISITSGAIIKTLLIILLGLALYYLRDLVLIILTSIVIATALEPGTIFLVRRKMPRIVAVIILYSILVIAIIALFYLFLPSLLDDVAGFMNMLPQKITALNVRASGIGSDFFSWRSTVQGLSTSGSVGQAAQNFVTSLSTASGSILATLTTIFGGAVSFLLILVLSFYFSAQERGIEEFLRLVAPLKHEKYIVSLWRRTQHKISRWIQGQIILALIVGVLVFIGLTILGVPNAFFLAVISTLFEVIPVFGPFIAAAPGILVAVLQGGFAFGVIVALMYLVIQQIESNIIYPLVVKKVVNVSPLVVMIALVVGGRLGGMLGVLLSVPVAAALTEYMNDLGKNRVVERERLTAENL